MYQNGKPQLQFDRHAFAGRVAKAVSATKTRTGWDSTGISFDDRESMHSFRKDKRIRRLPTPEWTMSNEKVREVVLRYGEDRYGIRDRSGDPATRMARIEAAEQSKLPGLREQLEDLLVHYNKNPQEHLPVQIQNKDSEILILERGVVKLATAVIYSYYRQGYTCVDAANEFALKPPMIRVWLFRFNTVANRLGFQPGPAFRNSNHKSYQRPPKNSIHYGGKEEALRLFALRAAGASWVKCAAALKLRYSSAAKFAWMHHFGDLEVSTSRLPKDIATPSAGRRVVRLRTLFILRTSGMTWEQCGQRLGIGALAAMKLWKRQFGNLNVARQGKCKPGTGKKHWRNIWTEVRVAQLRELRASGKTFAHIAEVMDLKRPQCAQGAYVRYVVRAKK